MRRVDFIVGAREFEELSAEHFMQDAVHFYYKGDSGEKMAREMTAGGFGSVPWWIQTGK
jgi:hypothetical protein